MKLNKLLSFSLILFCLFILLSFTIVTNIWEQIDLVSTINIQSSVSRGFDIHFSYFSLLGSVEITFLVAFFGSALAFLKKSRLAFVGWLLIIPATAIEVVEKLILTHPAPPSFFHRTILGTDLPSFYIQTDYSFPSGHVTRIIFLVSVLLMLTLFSNLKPILKVIFILILVLAGFLMMATRIYLGEHWLSDVLGGFLLGLSFGILASWLILKTKSRLTI